MCGIFGIGAPLKSDIIQKNLENMRQTLHHRGPDDAGLWCEDGFGFGMTRLSIIDLQGGKQPMWDDNRDVGVVYNGEVYNYRDLRSRLEQSGISFRTKSDTEVVLRSFVRDKNSVENWNGMFGVAFWSSRQKKLTLIRDRIGIKPLYYFWDGRQFGFASEIKALLTAFPSAKVVNTQAIWDYLTFRYVPGPETVWKNVWKLPPGHRLEWSPGHPPRIFPYWTTDVVADEKSQTFEESLRQFEDGFLGSVQKRLLASDVPVGVMLSGGLDSSCVAAAAVELGHRQFHTFSVGFEGSSEYSELSFARSVAKHVGAQYHEVVLGRDQFMEMLPETVRSLDEPMADLAAVPLLAVSRLARQWVKVVLSGEGSDEILAGYELDRAVSSWRRIEMLQKLPKFLLSMMAAPLTLLSRERRNWINQVMGTPLADWNRISRIHMTRHWLQEQKKSLWPSMAGLDSDRILDREYSEAKSTLPLDQILSVYQKSWLVEDLLMKADKMSMAASLELRVPFLDHELVSWANRQPEQTKVGPLSPHSLVSKRVLRQFALKRLPASIVERPKKGFPVPVYEWLRESSFQKWVEGQLLGRDSSVKDCFSSQSVREEMARSQAGDRSAAHRVWLLIVLNIWLNENHVQINI